MVTWRAWLPAEGGWGTREEAFAVDAGRLRAGGKLRTRLRAGIQNAHPRLPGNAQSRGEKVEFVQNKNLRLLKPDSERTDRAPSKVASGVKRRPNVGTFPASRQTHVPVASRLGRRRVEPPLRVHARLRASGPGGSEYCDPSFQAPDARTRPGPPRPSLTSRF